MTCPEESLPLAPPRRATRASRASIPEDRGQGWPARQLPSNSRAAMLPSRIFGPSAHQIGPSPSHTATGVQRNAALAATVSKLILRTFPFTLVGPCSALAEPSSTEAVRRWTITPDRYHIKAIGLRLEHRGLEHSIGPSAEKMLDLFADQSIEFGAST